MTKLHPIIRQMADADRAHDPFGSAMMTLGAVCDVMSVIGEGSSITPEAGYRPAMGLSRAFMVETDENGEPVDGGEFDQQRELLAALDPDDFPGFWVEGYNPDMDHTDLEYAAKVLSRYIDVVKLAGKDY